MKNGDKIRSMTDPELADFMRKLERQEVPYWQHECKDCVGLQCDDCRVRWLDTDPDEVKADPELFGTTLRIVNMLFEGETPHYRATLATEIYRKLRRDDGSH